MKTFNFVYTVTPNTNRADFWVDIKGNKDIVADSLLSAIMKFFSYMTVNNYIEFSSTAKLKKSWKKQYVDTHSGSVQTGLVFTGSTEIDFDREWKKRFVHIWTTITVKSNIFEELEEEKN